MIEHITLRTEKTELTLQPLASPAPRLPAGTRGLRPARKPSRLTSSLLLPGHAGRWALLRLAEGAGLLAVATVFAVALAAWAGL